jgi:site-specific DNA-methyltransferase (adenine-specific)
MIEREPKYCKFGEQRLNKTNYIDTLIANAVYDEKPLKVSMDEMITAGVFMIGEDFCFKNGKPVAKLCADGKLEYNGEFLDMHTCCALARQVKANRLNGFDYWYVIRESKPVAIADIRDEYRKTKQQ